MVQIHPFRGLRYVNENLAPLQSVVAPPYDVIEKPGQDKLYERNLYNCVRLILNRQDPSDSEHDNRYTRSAHCFADWQQEGILGAESAPALYAYTQTFKDQGQEVVRKGILALVKLSELGQGAIYPHEHTLKGPIKDRFSLMSATMANMSPVFMLYEDESRTLEQGRWYNPDAEGWQTVEIPEESGVKHALCPILDEGMIQEAQTLFQDKFLIIADGHHRYETAWAFRQEVRRRYSEKTGETPADGTLPSDYAMVFLGNMADGGLKVYPTHRILRRWPTSGGKTWDKEIFHQELMSRFEKANGPDDADFAVQYAGEKKQWVKLSADSPAMVNVPEVFHGLDVAILDQVIIQGMFGTTANALKDEKILWYDRNDESTEAMADNREAEVIFWMDTPCMTKMRDIITADHRMPQKSTYFFPKVLSGLVFYQQSPFIDGSGTAWDEVPVAQPMVTLNHEDLFPQPVLA